MSGKKTIIIILTFLMVLIALSGFALAFKEDFSLFSTKKDLNVGNCGTHTDVMSIINEGDVTSNYYISLIGDAKKYSTLAPSKFSLEPQESKIIYNYITLPCDVEGSFDMSVNVKTSFDLNKDYQRTLNVKKAPTFTVTDYGTGYEACSCTPVMYKYTIKNTGSDARTYDVSIDGVHSQYASLSEEQFMLAGGDTFNLFVYVTEPCYFYGESFFDISITEKETNFVATAPFYLKTKACYDFSVKINESLNVCNDEVGVYPFSIRSESDIGNAYSISSKDISLDTSKIFLWGGESAELNGTFLEKNPGMKKLTLSVMGERGQTTLDFNSNLDVLKCHSANIAFPVMTADASACVDKVFDVVLKNDGTKTEKYNLTLISPVWASLVFDKAMELAPGEERKFLLDANIPCNESGKFDMMLTAKIADRDISDSAALTLNVISLEEAHKPKILVRNYKFNYEANSIDVGIQNTGVMESTYELGTEMPPWMTSEIPSKLTLAPGETKHFSMLSQPGENVTETGYLVTVNAKVENSNGVTYSKSFTVTLQKETLWQKIRRILKDFFFNYWIYLLAGLVLGLFIVGLMVLRKRLAEKRKVDETIAVSSVPIAGISRKKIRKDINWSKILNFGLKLLLILALLTLIGVIVANIDTIGKFGKDAAIKAGGLVGLVSEKASEYGEDISKLAETISQSIPKTQSIIYINTSGLNSAGNLIKIKAFEKVTVPITIQNNDNRTVTYSIIPDADAAWINSEKERVVVKGNTNESFNIDIMADRSVADGLYEVNVEAAINEGNTTRYTEGILLEIEKTTPFAEKYLYYFLAGFATLIFLVIILFTKDKLKDRGMIRLKKEHPLDMLAQRKIKRKWFKFIGSILLLILIVVGVMYSAKLMQKGTEKSVEISGLSEEKIALSNQDSLDIVLNNNKNYDMVFFITNNAGFIEPAKKTVLVPANETRTEVLTVQKGTAGFYDINVEVTKKDKTPEYNSKIILQYTEKSKLYDYIIYVSAGLVGAILYVIFMRRSKNGNGSDKKALKIGSEPAVELKTESKKDAPAEKKTAPAKRSKELKLAPKKKK